MVALLIGALTTANAGWSPARAVQHRIDVVTDFEPPPVVAPATVPSVVTTNVAPVLPPTSASVAVAEPPVPTTTIAAAVLPPVVETVPVVAAPMTDPAIVGRPIPVEPLTPAAPVASPWANASRTTGGGYVVTDVGCATGTSAGALDAFFSQRIGPVLGHDYQHVYPLGGNRYLWLFQDTFVDYSGVATDLGQAVFAHNTALVQTGACFTLHHRGSITAPTSFEPGNGESRLAKWFWPMGGQTFDGKVYVFWAEMGKDGYEPTPPNGLGWHPTRTWLAVYDANTMTRLSFEAAPNSGVAPIYGFAVDSDAEFTYLFGNTFEQNLQREGGYLNGPHSGTKIWLARIPLGQFSAPLEYRTIDGWTYDAAAAQPILQRYWAENPMQPRYIGGQWVAVTKVNGYWGQTFTVDVANDSWGPWTTVENRSIEPRGNDPLMNTYHAHLMPWTDGGALVVSISQNARNMLRDAWPAPSRYRLAFFRSTLVPPPPRPDPIIAPVVADTTVLATIITAVDATDVTSVQSEPPVPPTTTTTTVPPPSPTSSPPPSTSVPPSTVPPSTVPPTTAPPTTTTAATTSTVAAPPDPSAPTTSTTSTTPG